MKLYADEDGHEAIRAVDLFVISALTRVEVAAALWRKHRMGELSDTAARVLTEAFAADLGQRPGDARLVVVGVTSAVLETAAELVATDGLRAYDGVQLSSALAAREADAGCATFSAFDRQLRGAAAARRFALLPA